MTAIRLNPEQHQAVTEPGPCLVVACPGSGKTRLLVSKTAWLLAQDPAHAVVAVTFTRDSAMELRQRIVEEIGDEKARRVKVGTFHSLCLQQLKLAGQIIHLLSPAEQEAFVRRAWELAGQGMELDEAQRLIETFKTELGRAPDDSPAGRLAAAYADLLQRNQTHDFQDLLINTVTAMRAGSIPPIPATHLLVDEFQDTDAIQYAWIREHSRRGAVVTVVGDDDQCQPADTRVLTAAGLRPISELDPANDQLYCHDGERLVRAGNFQVAQRRYHGPMSVVSAGGRVSHCTPDHYWRVRWRQQTGELFAVHLLRRGETWRLNAHRLLDTDGACIYGRDELDADAAWVLALVGDFHEAIILEAQLSLRFQLPLVWSHERLVHTAVARCLAAYQLDDRYPLWRKGELLAGQFLCRACNLLSERMEVPVVDGRQQTAWHPLAHHTTDIQTLPVYSLAVEPHHTYVADGLVTGNCIYSWRHAMGYDGMVRFEQEHHARRITLGANYRCHQEILESAGRVIVYNEARMDKELVAAKGAGGSIQYERFASREAEADAVAAAVAAAPDTWSVLARTNRQLDIIEAFLAVRAIPYTRAEESSLWEKPAVRFFLTLLRAIAGQGAPAGIDQLLHWAGLSEEELIRLHRAHGASLTRLPKRIGVELSTTGHDLLRSFGDMFAGWQKTLDLGRTDLVIVGASQWMVARAEDSLEASLLDIAARALMKIPGSLPARVAIGTSRERQTAERRGVALMSLHGSKGLEFDHVWMLGVEESLLPNEKSMLQEERRLMYVGMTRARNRLVVSSSDEHPVSRFVAEAMLLN